MMGTMLKHEKDLLTPQIRGRGLKSQKSEVLRLRFFQRIADRFQQYQ